MSKKMLLDKYPVDTEENIKAASAYFDNFEKSFSLKDRVKFARDLGSVQKELGMELSEKVAHYSNAVPRASVRAGIQIRDYLTGGQASKELIVIEKNASISPYVTMELLEDFDEAYGLSGKSNRLPNAFDSVFVNEKIASLDDEAVWVGPASDRLTKDKLQQWGENPSSRELLAIKFNNDIVEGLTGPNSWDVFKSLPNPTKQVISRMANDNMVNGELSSGRDIRSASGAYDNSLIHKSVSSRVRDILK